VSEISFDALQGKHILVVGGSGRVGGSVVTQLIKRGAGRVTVGGTNQGRFQKSLERWKTLPIFNDPELLVDLQNKVDFATIYREDPTSVSAVLQKSPYDLVVHTAGPFQGKVSVKNGVLEACVNNKVAYVDVCDDYCTASAAKTKYQTQAQENGVPCLLSTGCWVSERAYDIPSEFRFYSCSSLL
jgi:saccharopine dehydrogenase-like NADP-dependent oxidoreductase